MSIHRAWETMRRNAGIFRKAGPWFDVFRGVNKVYHEVSLDQLAAEAQRMTGPKDAPAAPDQATTPPPPVDEAKR